DVAHQNVELLPIEARERLRSRGHTLGSRAARFQNPREQRTAVRLIVNDEHRDAIEARQLDGVERIDTPHKRLTEAGILAANARDGQRDDERRALAFAPALHTDRAAVQLDEILDDGQSKSQAAIASGRRGIGLTKAFEHIREKFGAYA